MECYAARFCKRLTQRGEIGIIRNAGDCDIRARSFSNSLLRTFGGRVQGIEQASKPELRIQLPQQLRIGRSHFETSPARIDGNVSAKSRQLFRKAGIVRVLLQTFTRLLRLDVIRRRDQSVQRSVFQDQLRCTLLADSLHAGNIVARVSN